MNSEEIEYLLNNHEERIKKLESNKSVSQAKSNVEHKGKSLNEFILEKNLSDALQLTTSFAYYIYKFEAQESFNGADMQSCFKRARETMPSNINDKINQCIKKGWLSEHSEKKDGKKAFYITNKGISAVENTFLAEKKDE